MVDVKYQSVRSFDEGLLEVKLNDKWGFVDRTGKEIIPIKYQSVVSLFKRISFGQTG
jgi:hypothetical protein